MMMGTSAVSGGCRLTGGEASMIGGGQLLLDLGLVSLPRGALPDPGAALLGEVARSAAVYGALPVASAAGLAWRIGGAEARGAGGTESRGAGGTESRATDAKLGSAADASELRAGSLARAAPVAMALSVAPPGAGCTLAAATLRGASAAGGSMGRRELAALGTIEGARVIAAARVRRAAACTSVVSGSTITDGKRGRLALRGAGRVMAIAGLATWCNTASGGAGVLRGFPDGRARRKTGSSVPVRRSGLRESRGCATPGAWLGGGARSLLPAHGDAGSRGRERALFRLRSRFLLARVGIATSDSCSATGVLLGPACRLEAGSRGGASDAESSALSCGSFCWAASFLRCKMMRPIALATSGAIATTSAISGSPTSAAPLSAYSSTAQRPRNEMGSTKAFAPSCRRRSVLRVRSMPSVPNRVSLTLQLSAASESELGRSRGTPIPNTTSRSAPGPEASRPSASEL